MSPGFLGLCKRPGLGCSPRAVLEAKAGAGAWGRVPEGGPHHGVGIAGLLLPPCGTRTSLCCPQHPRLLVQNSTTFSQDGWSKGSGQRGNRSRDLGRAAENPGLPPIRSPSQDHSHRRWRHCRSEEGKLTPPPPRRQTHGRVLPAEPGGGTACRPPAPRRWGSCTPPPTLAVL